MCFGLSNAKIIGITAVLPEQSNKCFYGEGIVLCRDTKAMLDRRGAKITFFHQSSLFHDLTGIAEKFFAVRRDNHAFVCPMEDGNAKLVLQFLDRGRERRLSDVQPFSGLTDRSGVGSRHDVFELL